MNMRYKYNLQLRQTVSSEGTLETHRKVDEYLESLGAKLSSRHIGETLASKGSDEWECDNWSVGFDRAGRSLITTYRTGLGHRFLCPTPNGAPSIKVATAVGYRSMPKGHSRWSYQGAAPEGQVFVVKPCAASVLYCLLQDRDASSQSFTSWCDDRGYNSDSIKMRQVYDACQKTSDDLSRIFSGTEMAHLDTLLEDY